MKTLVLANQKGGVGKSAVATQLAYYLSKCGYRVLFVDLDHQKNSSKALIKSTLAVVAEKTISTILLGEPYQFDVAPLAIIQGDDLLSGLERQPDKHNGIANNLAKLLDYAAQQAFDLCIIDTNPNPDIRYAAALITADFVLSPIQLNQEAIDGIGALMNHPRYGFHKIKAVLNKNIELIGILPNMVESTPFQKENFRQLAQAYSQLLIKIQDNQFALIPKRSAIAEAQADGEFLADIKKTAARDAWKAIKPSFDVIANKMNMELKDNG